MQLPLVVRGVVPEVVLLLQVVWVVATLQMQVLQTVAWQWQLDVAPMGLPSVQKCT